ncbi:MAG: hypothetical protein Q8M94_17940 [Ignavibacteria bacterium]|nr:hypothetical protein [Ignavibacteria bacterium]
MANGTASGTSGALNTFRLTYEKRRIVVAQGLDFRDDDLRARKAKNPRYSEEPLENFLKDNCTTDFTAKDSTHFEYINDDQQVHFFIEIVRSKEEFSKALDTPGIHVIYAGHSRYGRGTCFDPDVSSTLYTEGERWEQGDSKRNGMFRLGYPFIGIPFSDMEHHKYKFAPVAVEEKPPSLSDRHPEARSSLSRILLPDSLKTYVVPEFKSPSNKYWGLITKKEKKILLRAGWENTRSTPFDLGSTELKCKVFCHFGCSSKLHYWKLIRKSPYKNWARDNPPTDRFAYFSDRPGDYSGWCYWLFYVLKYSEPNSYKSWWESLEYAKKATNKLLKSNKAPFQLY